MDGRAQPPLSVLEFKHHSNIYNLQHLTGLRCCSVGGLITPQPVLCNFNGGCLQFLRPPAQTPHHLKGCSHIIKAAKLMVQD